MTDVRCYGDDAGQRFLIRHHDVTSCRGDRCRGCQPCAEAHCYRCGKEHSSSVCPKCLTSVREDLTAIKAAYVDLPSQAANGGSDGHLEAARPIPGGEALVMLAPVTVEEALTPAPDLKEWIENEPHPLETLESWSRLWREWWNDPTSLRATITREADYLDKHLHRMPVEPPREPYFPPDFCQMADEISSARALLERILHDQRGGYPAAPCPNCRTRLTQEVQDRRRVSECLGHGYLAVCPLPRHHGCADVGGATATWRCSGCKATYTAQEYATFVARDYLDNATALTAEDLEKRAGIRASLVRVWSSRGKVRKRGKDAYGRQLYDVADVLRNAEGA